MDESSNEPGNNRRYLMTIVTTQPLSLILISQPCLPNLGDGKPIPFKVPFPEGEGSRSNVLFPLALEEG